MRKDALCRWAAQESPSPLGMEGSGPLARWKTDRHEMACRCRSGFLFFLF